MTNLNLKFSTKYGLLYSFRIIVFVSDYCIRFVLLYLFRIIVFVLDYCIRKAAAVEIKKEFIFVHMNEKWVGLWRVNGRELVAISG